MNKRIIAFGSHQDDILKEKSKLSGSLNYRTIL